jgi:diguanylate cyclase (GGDEF)-like protein
LIVSIAHAIEECLRTSDIICRYGGDEFVALLPQLPASKAREAGERLRAAVENTTFNMDGKAISSTVCIGIATYPDEVSDVYDLLEKADESLYECKRSGRNNVTSYTDISPKATVEHANQNSKFEVQTGGSRKTDLRKE